MNLLGGIEAGGTTFVCGVGTDCGTLHDREEFATEAPKETLNKIVAYFRAYRSDLRAIGIASFGPIALTSRYRGYVTATTKPGWAYTDFVGPIEREFGLPVGFDTDVNAAAIAEQRWGAAQGLDTLVYVTAGTGVGAGGLLAGNVIHGLVPSEMGHMRIPRHPDDPLTEGTCRFHRDCWEGWASKVAIEKRWGRNRMATTLKAAERELLGHYLALGVANVVCIFSPQRIILGGGVILGGASSATHRAHMFKTVRHETGRLLNGFIQVDEITANIDTYIVEPGLGNDAGVLGGIALAHRALTR